MLAMVWVVQIGSITRTSACNTARRTFSCAIADNGRTVATRPTSSRIIMESPTRQFLPRCTKYAKGSAALSSERGPGDSQVRIERDACRPSGGLNLQGAGIIVVLMRDLPHIAWNRQR